MQYRTLGRTGLRVSALALGTVELGIDYGIRVPGHYGRPPEEEAVALIHAALENSVNFIDTARTYGAAEDVIGKALRGRRDQAIIATKVATQGADRQTLTGDALRRHMFEVLETSLRTLQTDYVDIWQLHNLDQDLIGQLDVVADVFERARNSGKARWVGASTYGVEAPAAAVRCDLFDVIQATYSVLDQRLADGVFAQAQEAQIGIVARSILLQGVLTERGDYLPDRLEPLRTRSQRFRQLAAESGLGLSAAQLAVAFALAQPHINAALVGVRTVDELHENLVAVDTQIPADVLEALHTLRLDDPDLLNPATWQLT
ncbi:MAG: aldo/keto reductase [Caldilineaceae bacterium]